MPDPSIPRNRRADLLKVADLFFERLSVGLCGLSGIAPAVGSLIPAPDILSSLSILPDGYWGDGDVWDENRYYPDQLDYARELMDELPAFLKAEWERHRKNDRAIEEMSQHGPFRADISAEPYDD